MADFNLKLDENSLKQLAAESILAQLSDENRQDILKQAVSYLLTPKESRGYGSSGKTPLQESFETEIGRLSMHVAAEVLGEMPEVKEKLKTMMVEAVERAFEQNRETTVGRLADALVSAMVREDR